jgi:hypothetical protein
MKGILIILLIFGLVLLAAVAFALVPNLMTPAAPTLAPPDPGAAATPTLAAAAPAATLPPAAAATLPVVGSGDSGAAAFNGAFAGTLTSDDGSTAPVSLNLTQTGSTVAGDIAIGEGLTIDGGNCGAQAIPAGSRSVSGQIDPSNPNHIEVSAGYEVQGFNITAELIGDLSPDGNSLNGQIGLSLPFLCGRNPVITGALQRQ